MAASIHIRFLTGRAHLHPWHAAPNEGRVEFPPSPWRLLRALVAVAGRGLTTLPQADHQGGFSNDWFAGAAMCRSRNRKASGADEFWKQHVDALPLTTLAALLHKLTDPPVVWLPATGIGHTRHFFAIESGERPGTQTFDTFAAVDPEHPLVFEWSNVDLDEQETKNLNSLVSRLLYFGRAESWCNADVATEGFQSEIHWPCVATEDDGAFKEHFENRGWREHCDYTVEKRLGWDPAECAFLREEFKVPTADAPELLLRALLQPTAQSMKSGDRPWGTRWLHYAVPKQVLRLPVRTTTGRNANAENQLRPRRERQVVRYVLNTATVHRATLPPVTATLAIAQRCRAAAMAIFARQNGGFCSPQLSGKRYRDDAQRYQLFSEADGEQVVKFGSENGSHSAHAFWWPVDEDCDGFLDHLIVLCKDGFSERDLTALLTLNRIEQAGSRASLLLTPAFEGKWEECPTRLAKADTASEFISATPYFCPVHLRGRSGRARSLKDQIRQSLSQIGLPTPDEIDEIVFDYDPSSLGSVKASDPRQEFLTHVQTDLQGPSGETVVQRGGFLIASLNAPLPVPATGIDPIRYPRACTRDPDQASPLGLSRGLYVSNGQRFVPALAFHRIRTEDDQAKGPGMMLRIRFSSRRPSRPFAIGQFCHFGLGLFVPSLTYSSGA
jgi:CRISPR-associated protein Csb2